METVHVSLAGAFIAGLLSFLTPCVLPLIPSYVTYITGFSFADLQSEHPLQRIRRQTIIHSLLFIVGFTIVFVLLGASATFLGGFLRKYMSVFRQIGGVLIILFGIHVSGLVPIAVLLGEKRVVIHSKQTGYLGSLLVGLAFAAGWTPCIGPILATILMVAATEETVAKGILLLLAYSLGLAIPFFFSALAMHQFLVLFNRFKKYIRIFEVMTGLFLVVTGILVFFNWFAFLSSYAATLLGGR
ncbi:MAG TPA: cytochrome c biogenesis protein CcdA [Geobacteraceae bacterium]